MSYKRVNWENAPSEETPVNADNLNNMDEGIKNIEDGTIKVAKAENSDKVNNFNLELIATGTDGTFLSDRKISVIRDEDDNEIVFVDINDNNAIIGRTGISADTMCFIQYKIDIDPTASPEIKITWKAYQITNGD